MSDSKLDLATQAATPPETTRQWLQIASGLMNYTLAAGAASLLMAAVELADTSILLTPVFESAIERVALAAYYSVNVIASLAIGLVLGLAATLMSYLKQLAERVLARGKPVGRWHKLVAAMGLSGLTAFLLNQHPQVHRYVIGLIREAEKVPFLNQPLLNHERSISYLSLAGMVIFCYGVYALARSLPQARRPIRVLGLAGLAVPIVVAYYVDSRIEVQLYEHSLHLSMFLIELVFSIALVAAFQGAFEWRGFRRERAASLRFGLSLIALAGLAAAATFTWVRFDANQNLKVQVFYRTTHAKQYFQLVQWAFDFDGDGYSALLGDGDSDDSRPEVNPSQKEVVGDGVDNNCIGGDLLAADLERWSREQEQRRVAADPAPSRLNLIWVFIDALRADHLGSYGYSRATSPNIDKLASRAAVFENAYTPSPNTFEALPKFMQSSYWDARLETWPEVLARNGYETLLFPRRPTTLLRHVRGMKVVEEARVRTFEGTIDRAIEAIGRVPSEKPFAAFLYSTDPHRPFQQRDEFWFGSTEIDLYDGEIAYADYHLGRLFDWLERTGRLDTTMIVIMADHGESLGERSVYKHSTQLYNEQTRVPMIIHLRPAGARRIADYVSTVDLGVTVLDALGFESPKGCAGVSLVPLMRGEAVVHPPVYGEQTGQEVSPYVQPQQNVHPQTKKYMVITQDGYKLIYNRNYYCFELFDLKSDPREERNLYDRLPGKAAELRALLGRFIDIVQVSRPADADESQYRFGAAVGREEQ